MTHQPRDEPDAAMSTPVASWPSYRCGNPGPHPAHRGMAGPSLCRGNPAPDGDGQAAACHCGLGTCQQCATEPWGCAHDREHATGPTLLARVLADQGISQADLARRTRLSTKHVNQICQGVAHISVDVAIRLEFVLGIDAAEWMRADTPGQIAHQRDDAVLALVRPELEQLRETRAAVDTADLRERIAALFRTAPGKDRLGDEVPGYIADAVLGVLANPPAGGQETGTDQAGGTP